MSYADGQVLIIVQVDDWLKDGWISVQPIHVQQVSSRSPVEYKFRHVPHATSPLGVVHFTTASPCLDMGFDFLKRLSAVPHSSLNAFPRPVKTVTNRNIHVRILLKHGHFQVSYGKSQRTVPRKIDRFAGRVRAKGVITVRFKRRQSRRFQQRLERDQRHPSSVLPAVRAIRFHRSHTVCRSTTVHISIPFMQCYCKYPRLYRLSIFSILYHMPGVAILKNDLPLAYFGKPTAGS